MKIIIETKPKEAMRYDTCGDWTFDGENIHIDVEEQGCWQHNVLIGIHELVEAVLCKQAGISEESVTEFDIQFEKDRALGIHDEHDEPGDSIDAPYMEQHQFATEVEKNLCIAMLVPWEEYNNVVVKL